MIECAVLDILVVMRSMIAKKLSAKVDPVFDFMPAVLRLEVYRPSDKKSAGATNGSPGLRAKKFELLYIFC